MMVMMVVMMAAGESGYRHHDRGDEQKGQKLFHASDYSQLAAPQRSV